MPVTIDWENLGFSYMKLPYRFIAYYKNGQWSSGALTEDAELHISESSPALHYGQQAFEGLKAYRTKDGKLQSNSPTLDRIENGKLINKNNIMIVCHTCNATKRNRTMVEFVEYCENVVKKFAKRPCIGRSAKERDLVEGNTDIPKVALA